MNKVDVIWIVISLAISLIAYLTSMNYLIAIAILVIYVAYYFFLARKKFISYFSGIERVHSCYHFINSFLVTLSVKESLDDAFESGTRIENKKLNEIVLNISDLNIYERVSYLRNYFNLSIYKMFLNILNLYQDQGGNILAMSDNLIRECTRTENTLNETLSISRKHLVEFGLLWFMSLGIVLFMRFGISDFYIQMLEMPIFKIMLFIFFLICLFSIHLFITKYTDLTIKEDAGL